MGEEPTRGKSSWWRSIAKLLLGTLPQILSFGIGSLHRMFVQYVIARWSDRLERVVRLNETSVASLLLEWCDENVSQALSLALCALTWWIQTDFCVCDVFRVYRQTMLNSTTLFHGPQHVELTRLERLLDSFDPRTNQFLSKKERTKEQRWSYRWDRAMHQHKIPGVGGFLSTQK